MPGDRVRRDAVSPAVVSTEDPLLTAALQYAELGWYLLPVDGKKPAFTSWQAQSSNDPMQIRAWFTDGRHGIGLDLGKSGLVVLDADRPERLGAAGLDADSLDGWSYRGNPDRRSWLYRLGDIEVRQGKAAWGDIKGRGGLVVLPGSPHHGTPDDCSMCEVLGVGGHHYEWISRIGSRPPVLSDDVAARLPQRRDLAAVAPWAGTLTGEQRKQADDWLLDRRMEIIGRLARTAIELPGEDDVDDFGKGWEARSSEAAFNLARLVVTGWLAYDVDDAREDFEKALPEDLAATDECPGKFRDAVVPGLLERAAPWAHQPPWADPVFDATPILQHIRQAAHSRGIPAETVLLGCINRVLLRVPVGVTLPATVGARASLNLGTVAVGSSGAAKTTSEVVAAEVLGLPDPDDWVLSIGSGEGLVDAYYEWVLVQGANGRASRVLQLVDTLVRHRLFSVDEGETLRRLTQRSGTTLGAFMRTALTGGRLGTSNSKSANAHQRHVPAGTYRLLLHLNLHPKHADILLGAENEDIGMPQRFLWLRANVDALPENVEDLPTWPGSLDWRCPDLEDGDVTYPESIEREVKQAHLDAAKGRLQARRAHGNLTRLKVALALAMLHDETAITEAWWSLAGGLLAASFEVQDELTAAMQEEVQKEVNRREVRRVRAVEAAGDDQFDRAVVAVLDKMRKVPVGQEVSWHQVRPGRSLRDAVDKDEVLAAVAASPGFKVVDGKNANGSEATFLVRTL